MYILRGRAFRCLDCDAITNNSRQCEACGSGALVNEDRLLEHNLSKLMLKYPQQMGSA